MTATGRRLVLCVLTGLVLAVGLLHPLWRAEWAVMDDHSMLTYIGPTGRLPWSAVPSVLAQTEGAHPGVFSRYRPGLFGAQVIEAALIGPNPRAWFAWRTVQFALVMAAICWVAGAFVPSLLAVLLTLYTSTQAYWSDSFVHLFVSECWSATWFAVFLVAAERFWRRHRVDGQVGTALSWLAVSGALAASTKENLLILLPFAWAALWWSARWRRLPWHEWGAAALSAAMAALIVVAVIVGLRREGGADLYGNTVTIGGRLALFARPLPVALAMMWAALLVAARVSERVGAAQLAPQPLDAWRALWRTVLGVAAASTLVAVSQFVFYNGAWPTGGSRFDFPGRLIEIVAYVMAWVFAMRAADIWRATPAVRRTFEVAYTLVLCLLILRHPAPLLRMARGQAALTHAVGDARRAIAAEVAATPDRPIVLLAASPVDVEPAISLARQVRVVEHLVNPLYVDARSVAPDPARPIDARWTEQLQALSVRGGGGSPGRLADPVSPWTSFAERRARGGPAPLCVALHEYNPVERVVCPAEWP